MVVEDAKRQRKLVYNRNLLRQKRCKYLSERQALMDELTALEVQLHAQRASSAPLLPWREVMVGLKDDREFQERLSKELASKYHTHKEIFRFLSKWANQVVNPQVEPPLPATDTWRNVTLLHNVHARRLGMDWITQQLYHNTDRCFYMHGVPSAGMLNDFQVNCSAATNDTLSYIWRFQHEFDMPFDPCRDALRDTVEEFVMGGLWNSRFSCFLDQHVVPDGAQYARSIRSPDEAVNYLVREFASPDDQRVTFVGRNILDDENHPASTHQSHRIFWYDLEKLSPTRTKLRILILKSQDISTKGYVALDEEATYWGCNLRDCPDHLKLQTFRTHAHNTGKSLLALGVYQVQKRMLQASSPTSSNYSSSSSSISSSVSEHHPIR
ncbi:hypothetical protein DYB37_000005 [Aphanomyces astaci]|uniref:BZIP domain-containing protein n=1 Tax=Aphanomyces astaci TaxID=112090 RepID=A0A3R6XKX4_APHAT|nr:hypothetical protein DYB37_000005 [Aphanomyces astaci]